MIIEMQRIQTNPNNRIYLLLKGNIFAFLNKFYLNQPVAVFYINKINIVNTYKLHYFSLKKDLLLSKRLSLSLIKTETEKLNLMISEEYIMQVNIQMS